MRKLRKPNVEKIENMECYYYYYESVHPRVVGEQLQKQTEYYNGWGTGQTGPFKGYQPR